MRPTNEGLTFPNHPTRRPLWLRLKQRFWTPVRNCLWRLNERIHGRDPTDPGNYNTIRDYEHGLRKNGLSKSQAIRQSLKNWRKR